MAQQPGAMPMNHAMPAAPAADGVGPDSPAGRAYRQAHEGMMRGMDVPVTGDADRDFVNGMIPHHQGAVEMARVQLRYGKDPVLRRLARAIVAAQEKEIALMKDWQRRHPAAP